MSATIDPRVDAYIAALPSWQQAICQGDTLNAPAFTAMVQHIIATNRAGADAG